MTKSIRISDDSYERLSKLVIETGSTKKDLLDKAIKKYSRELFFEKVNREFAELKKDPVAWKEELELREDLESLDRDPDDYV